MVEGSPRANRVADGGLAHLSPTITLLLTIGLFVVVTLATFCRWPLVWCDEPYFLDPAFHLAYEGRFTSETAYAGPVDMAPGPGELWTGNCPLYSLLVAHWMRWFGFSLFTTRSLNVVLYTLAVGLLTAALRRRGFLATHAGNFLLPTLMFSSYGLVFLYRQSRYDVLCILECAAMFLVLTIDRAIVRRGLLVVLAMTVPWSGFPAVAWLAAAFAAGAVTCGRRVLVDGVFVGIGLALGLASLFGWLHVHGSLQSFLAHVRSVQDRVEYTVSARLWLVLQGLFRDRAGMALWCASAVLMISRARTRHLRRDSPVVIASTIAFCGAVLLCTVTNRVYDWMVTIPLAMGVVAEVSGVAVPILPRPEKVLAWSFAVLAALGLPSVLLASAYEWNERDHARVERFVAENITADDFCFCDITAYFPARQIASRLLVDYGTWPTAGLWHDVELQARRGTPFTVMVIQADRATRTIKEFDGGWREVARLPESHPTWDRQAPFNTALKAVIEVVYPPPLASDRNKRISTDRIYDLVVLRRTKD